MKTAMQQIVGRRIAAAERNGAAMTIRFDDGSRADLLFEAPREETDIEVDDVDGDFMDLDDGSYVNVVTRRVSDGHVNVTFEEKV